jgi:uncharacterized membrane protein YhaH (DUF805 family)
MDIQTAIKTCFNKYATFSGRARRSEFWWFMLAIVVVSVLIEFLGLDVISIVFSLAVFVPSIAVSARRLHDIDKSGWWQLIGLIPVIGWIIAIIWYAKEGSTEANRFGAPAKTVSEFDVPD